MKRSFIAAVSLLISASPVLAQKGFTGGELRPIEEDVGAPAFLANQAIGDAMLADHARIRLSKQTIFKQLLRVQAAAASAYDSAASWTGKNCVTPVQDQGQTNMCWNFSATAALESSYCVNKGQVIDAAEQSVMECFAGTASKEGRHLTRGSETKAYDVMRGMGVEQEVFRPWNPASISACVRTPVLFREYYGVEGVTVLTTTAATKLPTVADIKQGIVDNGAVTLMMYVTPTFNNWRAGVSDAITSPAAEITTAKQTGAIHEIVITGWNDTTGAWHVKNSWNTGWGDAGFAWVVYNDAAMFSHQFTHVTPVTKRGAPDLNRVVLLMFERLIRIPSIWVANPRIQFPSSLGFPREKQTIIDGTKFAISKSLLPKTVVNLWPANVRSTLQ